MELPSMVQRSGDTLIVRSVVSGNQLYLDQGAGAQSTSSLPASQSSGLLQQQQQQQQHHLHNNNAASLEQQFERYRVATVAQQQHYLQQQQQQNAAAQAQQQQQQSASLVSELKDEGLPQCKIKRNYSCSYCTYFTQNPRYHLTHLRDVHGEKIVINKCKLCLYASRHFQKLVRHMKMVHGCTDGIAGSHGQSRGKRGMSREARKRKLEQSVAGNGASLGGGGLGVAGVGGVPEMPTLEQVKRELELQEQKLQRDIQAFNKQQEEQKKQQHMVAKNAAVALMAYEQLQAQAQAQLGRATYEQEAANAAVVAAELQRRQSPVVNATAAPNNNNKNSGFQMPPAHQQQTQSHISNHSYELTPSPNGSETPPSCSSTPTNNNNNNNNNSCNTNANISASLVSGIGADEPPQNRLLKCSICEFTTLYRAALVDHELEEHRKTKFFRCEKCSYVTHIKARFSKHVKYHSMPMIKCVTCDFRTPYKWNLDRHMKNHGGAGPFKCAACDFTADIKQSLTVHEMNHHVPPVGHAAGMSLARRRNKVGGTDLCDDFLSDSAELLEDHYNNNNLDEFDEAALVGIGEGDAYGKRSKYDDDEPTDLSAKGGSSDTSSVHNQSVSLVTVSTALTPKSKRPVPNLIPIPKVGSNVLNLSKDSSLSEIASMFFNEKQLSEMLLQQQQQQQLQQHILHEKTNMESAVQQQLLSPTTTITSVTSIQNSRSLLMRKPNTGGSFFDKLKSSALACASNGANDNLFCPCGHIAKCLSESIIHRKTCTFNAIAEDDIEEEDEEELDDTDTGRLEIDFVDEDDKLSHSALNLSVTGSTRCQHCRHRCKSSADLLNHLKHCTEAGRCGHESYDSMSGESSTGAGGGGGRGRDCGVGNTDSAGDEPQHPMENRVFIWNKIPRGSAGAGGGDCGSQCSEEQQRSAGGDSSAGSGVGMSNGLNEENSYYGVETAPGYGEVTKKMTAEEEAANSSLKKVYKCPHCSFWASTASRFHVHIVGHLNKKPFECSLCSYRSNWRWDITKHIRLKTIRDPSHKNARVLMNDETGRRNYTKYNKYITLMKVTEEDGDPKLMKSGEMTPNQVASLAFLNDFNKNGISAPSAAHLNGLKDDITLEPVCISTSKTSAATAEASGGEGGQQLGDGFIRLPLLATMMMAQQQQQKDQEHEHTTMITPSVTISAVKRSPPPLMKPSDDLVTESNEKKAIYKCRKCSFRHLNRDAVLAHVKIHYQDPIYPIVTATATTSPKSSSNIQQQEQQQQHTTPLQVAVNSNLYMNKVFAAAMCLSQQQQQQQQNTNSHNQQQQQQQQQHSILSAGLLQQAIQGAGNSSSSSSKTSPTKLTTASILEHGEQKASQNEASAQPTPTSPIKETSSSSALHFVGGVGGGASLQHLLTSPRGNYHTSSSTSSHHQQLNSPLRTTTTNIVGAGAGTPTNCNNNLVMGLTGSGIFNSPTATFTRQQQQQQQQHQQTSHSPAISPSRTSSAIVTTLPTTPTTNSSIKKQMGLTGAPSSASSAAAVAGVNSPRTAGGLMHHHGVGVGHDNVCIGGVSVYGSSTSSNNSSSLNCNINTSITTTTIDINTPITTTTSTTSCNMLLSSATSPSTTTTTAATAATTSASPSSANANFSNSNPNSSNNTNSNNNLLSHGDGDRRDPSPYRCGHCHQVSNWKHVIQRHCRLKHAGDIRIETLDRSAAALNERNPQTPLYRPLGSGASNEASFGLTLKTLQQQQQQQQTNLSNNNSVLIGKQQQQQQHEHLLHSPLAGTAATNAANAATIPQDIQAAAAAYLAAYKAANARNVATSSLSGDDLLLQQQLQQNDQIEITRLPAGAGSNSAVSSNLAHLLENSNAATNVAAQLNSKCKQQKCPLCPYISESKSQMNYHISLHKPTQYECPMCTFVCAKKQHLSSHMRSVHGTCASSTGTSGLNLDFSVALQLAAAAQAQQDTASLSAIDLTALKSLNAAVAASGHHAQQQQQIHTSVNTTANNNAAQQQLLLPPEYQFKMIFHCPKCPARFAQKHNEAHYAKAELREHLKAHHSAGSNLSNTPSTSSNAHKCEFCDYHASHETLTQTHRYVHTQHYQDKFNELYRNCKEDTEYSAPRLMQITSTRSAQNHETVWVVDLELSGAAGTTERQQHSNISSSSATPSNYDSANSLLKKQLEAAPAPLPARETPSPKSSTSSAVPEVDDSSNTTPSTSASVATSDLAGDLAASSDTASNAAASPALIEKCAHCPFESKNAVEYKAHLQQHICVSQQKLAHTCEHCDYSAPELAQIEEHTRVHFNAMEKLKSVAFFTSYDNLELSVEQPDEDMEVEANNAQEQHAAEEEANKSNETALEHSLNIKQENNNEENAVNENTLRAKTVFEASMASSNKSNLPPPAATAAAAATTATEKKPTPPACTKIILYKNDGCLSIKKDPATTATETNRSSDNISDRLRRRISRSSNSHVNGGGEEHTQQQQQQQQSHKTILVNAKTGQVISRN